MPAIAIPACDSRPHCKKMLDDCIQSYVLGEYTYPLIVMFDGCNNRFVDYFMVKYPFIVPFINKGKNYGFARNANIGMRYAHQQLETGVYVLNMDTILPHSRYLSKLTEIEGMATPTQIDLNPTRQVLSEYELKNVIENLDNINEEREFTLNPSVKFAGFCMWFSKSLMDMIGYLDEGFISTFEDDDACLRTCLAAMPCIETNIAVHHYIANRTEISTTGAYNQQRMGVSEFRFKMKWQIPGPIPHAMYNSWIIDTHEWNEKMVEK